MFLGGVSAEKGSVLLIVFLDDVGYVYDDCDTYYLETEDDSEDETEE